jgi:hypothetical protein
LKKTIFAFILAVVLAALLMDVTWMIYERSREEEEDGSGEIMEETILTPDEVNLSLNISSRGLTNYSNDFMVGGAPAGAEFIWYIDESVVGTVNPLRYIFMEAGHYDLEVKVFWSSYSLNLTRQLSIERVDEMGSTYLNYPWYWPLEDGDLYEPIVTIRNGLTEPTLWVNVSFTVSRTVVKCWIELVEEDKMETFEVVSYDVVPAGQMVYERSHYFNGDFFEEREYHEDYYFRIRLEFSYPDAAVLDGEVSYQLDFDQ